MFLFLRVKKHVVALPEFIGKTLCSFGGVEAEGREERKRRAALALICSRLVRAAVICVATRPAAWNTVWKTSVVTGIGANTTHQSTTKQNVSKQTELLISLTRNSDQTHMRKNVKTKPSNTTDHDKPYTQILKCQNHIQQRVLFVPDQTRRMKEIWQLQKNRGVKTRQNEQTDSTRNNTIFVGEFMQGLLRAC